ncbi:MAG: hypothetical protein WBD28_12845 [Candidatus Zixiibacteriota bacterium]
MKCYFSAKIESTDKLGKKRVLISFAMPDLGVLFRTHFRGELDECNYISLLKLLKFIESNPNIFDGQRIQVYSHDPQIVYQVNGKMLCEERLHKLNSLALLYKGKLKYSLDWIHIKDNKAEMGILDQPQTKIPLALNFDELDDSLKKRVKPRSNTKRSPLSM